MKYCPYCGTVLVEGAVSFCAECGKKLSTPVNKEKIQETSNQSNQQKKSNLQQKEQNGKPRPLEKAKEKEADTPEERKPEPCLRPEQQQEPSAVTKSTEPEDYYDGYYDDILPVDEGRFCDGLDRGLVKKIVLIIGVVFLIVGVCVLMMYFL